ALHRLLGVVVDPIAAQAGLSCVPISAVGVGAGGECDSQLVCCANNHMRGLVVVGCSPINVNT
ncbi:fungal hydrophobin, partial [Agrocybe pediades]